MLRLHVLQLTREQLTEEMDFGWFANDCRTWGAFRWRFRDFKRKDLEHKFYATTALAEEANRDADRTSEIIRDKSFTEFDNRTDFTFAIENPSGELKNYPAMKALIEDARICACVVKISQYALCNSNSSPRRRRGFESLCDREAMTTSFLTVGWQVPLRLLAFL